MSKKSDAAANSEPNENSAEAIEKFNAEQAAVSAGADGIDYPYPTIVEAGQAFTVVMSKITAISENIPTFIKAGYVLTGYGLSIASGGLAATWDAHVPATEREAVAYLNEAWSEGAGFGASLPHELSAQDYSKIDWSKFDFKKILAAITTLIKIFAEPKE